MRCLRNKFGARETRLKNKVRLVEHTMLIDKRSSRFKLLMDCVQSYFSEQIEPVQSSQPFVNRANQLIESDRQRG